VRKNHGTSRAATMNSTSRKSTLSDAVASASPETRASTSIASGIASSSVARKRDEIHDEQDDEHRREAYEMRADDRERHELARETNLPDEIRVVEHRASRRLQCCGEERPHRESGEEEQRIVAPVRERRLPHDAEHEQVYAHQHDRIHDRPEHAERRAAVLRLEVTAEQIPEQLAVANEIGVD